jgi:1-deoxy-D-xylulose-5-phosphate reductoisomerase
MKRLSVLGSTGSIGVNTLDIAGRYPGRFGVSALACGRNFPLVEEQAHRFRPNVVAVKAEKDALALSRKLNGTGIEVLHGIEGVVAAATDPDVDMVVSSIVGAAGLLPTMAAIEAGKDVALANKETLVTAGVLFMDAVKRKGVRLLPVDSEHSAIFQSLKGHRKKDVKRIILTASGGPFREKTASELKRVTPAQALKHPNWDMGAKITIDSSTLMNKGLEVIEARWLFDVEPERISVVVHPQSIIHSMVEYVDGTVIAQLGVPDMRGPISYALGYPERLGKDMEMLDIVKAGTLTFYDPDLELFPCLGLAYDALEAGGDMPAVLNAANEVAVEAFLSEKIGYTDIPRLIRSVMDAHTAGSPGSIDDVMSSDASARRRAKTIIASWKK